MSRNLQLNYERPPCPKCGAKMMLYRFDRESLDHGTQKFDCISWDHYETLIVQYSRTASAPTGL